MVTWVLGGLVVILAIALIALVYFIAQIRIWG